MTQQHRAVPQPTARPVADAMHDLGGSPTLPAERAAMVRIHDPVLEELHARNLRVVEPVDFDIERRQMLVDTIMPGATDPEIDFFAHVCKRLQLDPFAKQIHAVKRRVKVKEGNQERWVDRWSFQVAIDGFRIIAERTGKYRGQRMPLFCGKDGVWREVWLDGYPVACKVGVLRSDFDEPLYAIAKWGEYVQTAQGNVTSMWAKMPTVMLAKVAEALALRKAFPQELSGVYSDDEMAQADNDADAQRAEARRANRGEARDASATAPAHSGPAGTTGEARSEGEKRADPTSSASSSAGTQDSTAASSSTSPTGSNTTPQKTTSATSGAAATTDARASRYATTYPMAPHKGVALDAVKADGTYECSLASLERAGEWCAEKAKKPDAKNRAKLVACAKDIAAEIDRRAVEQDSGGVVTELP